MAQAFNPSTLGVEGGGRRIFVNSIEASLVCLMSATPTQATCETLSEQNKAKQKQTNRENLMK